MFTAIILACSFEMQDCKVFSSEEILPTIEECKYVLNQVEAVIYSETNDIFLLTDCHEWKLGENT